MGRYFLEVQYDGTAFHGSQIQNGVKTVQGCLNDELSKYFRRPIETFGSSRTDEGVHALQNMYHIDIDDELKENFLYSINAMLPKEMALTKVYKSADSLNARFDATFRKYRYRIYCRKNPFLLNKAYYYPYPINLQSLNEYADVLIRKDDFASFAKRNSQTKTTNCIITESYWHQDVEELQFVVKANRFLRGMVRALVATQLKFQRLNLSQRDLEDLIQVKDCTKAFFDVPGHGLYLEEIGYPENELELLMQL